MNKIKLLFTVCFTKLLIIALRLVKKGGTNFPGKVALKMYNGVLKDTSAGYKTIFVTGTNGKTTTTKMIVNMIRSSGQRVITNDAGANMKAGITTCFIKNYTLKKNKGYAVIEIDEANVRLISDDVKIDYMLITNIFRDQLDRYGEVYTTLTKILDGIKSEDTVFILNGDEPLFGDIDKPNKKLFFGLDIISDEKIEVNVEGKFCIKCGTAYSYNFVTYSHLGDYYCTNCGYKRPHIDYIATDVVQNKNGTSSFVYNGNEITIKLTGLYNVYNALSAIGVIEALELDTKLLLPTLEKEESPFGRQEEVFLEDKRLILMLVKNPSGFNEALNTLNVFDNKVDAAFLLNDNFADGTDVSWIYDVSFEKVSQKLGNVFVGGTRAYDMAIRLNVAGVTKEKIKVVTTYHEFLELFKHYESEDVYIFLTYTAMMEFRKYLYDKKYIKKLY